MSCGRERLIGRTHTTEPSKEVEESVVKALPGFLFTVWNHSSPTTALPSAVQEDWAGRSETGNKCPHLGLLHLDTVNTDTSTYTNDLHFKHIASKDAQTITAATRRVHACNNYGHTRGACLKSKPTPALASALWPATGQAPAPGCPRCSEAALWEEARGASAAFQSCSLGAEMHHGGCQEVSVSGHTLEPGKVLAAWA